MCCVMSVLDPAGLEAAARAIAAAWNETRIDLAIDPVNEQRKRYNRDAEAAVRAYLAALPVPSDTENRPTNPFTKYVEMAGEMDRPDLRAGWERQAAGWEEGFQDARDFFAAGRAAAHLPDGVLAFVNWFAEGPCGCDGESDDPCDSCRALALLASFDGSAAVHPDPPGPRGDELVTGYITGDEESLRFVDAMTPEEFAKFERRIDEAFADPATPAASPDERLREAGEQLANLVTLLAGSDGPGYFAAPNQGERPDYYATAKLFDRIMRDEKTGAAIVLAEWRAALVAADREAPDEAEVR